MKYVKLTMQIPISLQKQVKQDSKTYLITKAYRNICQLSSAIKNMDKKSNDTQALENIL